VVRKVSAEAQPALVGTRAGGGRFSYRYSGQGIVAFRFSVMNRSIIELYYHHIFICARPSGLFSADFAASTETKA
jgi:hypothetical protein